jgi:hypothetical protein
MKVGNKPPKMQHSPFEGNKPPQMPHHDGGGKPPCKPGDFKGHGEPPKHLQDPMHKSPFKEHLSNKEFKPSDMQARFMSMNSDGNL